ncbi:hypothetical protein [Noviherbaspirillum saxi]|uniref:Uncharacterized protein n=1 Tax=Noviherbaspirillum saxi TaxID=2320863 RepID=A0A3A3FQS8_9BURK|nr:hypothetical protein [Noviherbaspirillum saxi]RJF98572.1 hypothetical protein D3871_08670 [Noviherbaspirillum saxi]
MSQYRRDRSEYWIPPQKATLPEAATSRPDLETATNVELGIMMQETAGTQRATEFLKKKMVPVDVTMRVLLRPSERRKPRVTARK